MAKLGISGTIAKRFLGSQITPLLALVGVLLGIFAVIVTPREEDPQINVTFANVFIAFPGASASEVESLVAIPAEQVISEISGIKHVYSTSSPGMATLTVQFKVGQNRTDAIVRLYNKLYSNRDWLPANLGVGLPIIKPKGIDDVPIIAATLWSKDPTVGAYELSQVAHGLETELKRIAGTRDIYTIGSPKRVMHVVLDPQALAAHHVDINDLARALRAANTARTGLNVTKNNHEIRIQAGTFLTSPEDIGELVVGVFNGKAVYLQDVAHVVQQAESPSQYVSIAAGRGNAITHASNTKIINNIEPAVTLAIAKKPGSNAVDIARQVIQRLHELKGTFIPDNIEVTITRNYGVTAEEKSEKLIHKLIIETVIVIFLVMGALGWREGIVVGSAVAVTLLITLFASWAYGFTLNRVSLFALIFSIGILVDDAIVIVENIHRHLKIGDCGLRELIPRAVDEVGSPTILATFTVIAALLPMAFVSGLMGPYMSPIPINASMGMLISLAVAFVFTPWLTYTMLKGRKDQYIADHTAENNTELAQEHVLNRFFSRLMTPFLAEHHGKRNRWLLLAGLLFLISAAISLVVFKVVILKMLPFDNKNEFQVVLDMPAGTSLEQTNRVLQDMGMYLGRVKEVSDYEIYAGTSSPISFNGLVRQYYLRHGANMGDIQVNLIDKHHRERKSHDIARAVRAPLQAIARKYHGNVKIVEVPPGPPVMSPIVAEVYGLDYAGQILQAKAIRKVFESTPDVVDVDDSVEYPAKKLTIQIDRQRAARLGVSQKMIGEALATVLHGADVTYMHGKNLKYAVPIRIEYAGADKADLEQVLALKVRSVTGKLVPLSGLVIIKRGVREQNIYHKDLLPVVYVTGNLAGKIDSPLYGMFEMAERLKKNGGPKQWFTQQPNNPYEYSLKWDGEWQITYETFRDMGIAYAVGLLMIYLLVVAQFHSYKVPLVIMAPIPLTIIGILPGHALLGAQFTATSMIGMIALAGIIVRNSILLVDFINQQVREGMDFRQAVINSAAVRAKPIVLTGLAAMTGGFFIINDPIFSGLAISLIFGLLVSTVLTLVVIPVVYYAVMREQMEPVNK